MDDATQARLEALANFQAGFLANASHELRAPMTQIISLHQLILSDLCEDPAEEREFLRQSFEATQKVLANLDLLISVSKLGIGRLQPKLETHYLQDAFVQLQMLVQMLTENRGCRLSLEANEADQVYSDIDWLVQVLRLLVEGAIAAKSEQLQLRSQTAGDHLQILVTTDSRATDWELPPEPLSHCSDLELEGSLPSFSPGYCQQLASRILEPLGGTLHSQGTDLQTFVLTLPCPVASA